VGYALAELVQDERERARRLKQVGLWTIQNLAKNLISLYNYAAGGGEFRPFIVSNNNLF